VAKARESDDGWDIDGAIRLMRATMDPYLWEQGQELYSRGAIEDFSIQKSGEIQVRVRDPRDARIFFVELSKDRHGRVRVVCRCPYQLGGHCRHQVVAVEYVRAIAQGSAGAAPAADPGAGASSTDGRDATPSAAAGPVLYRLFETSGKVSTQPDGSLLRVVVHGLGSARKPHRAGLQLFTGTGWTELRTADVDRWIGRGARGAHARDAVLARQFLDDGVLRNEIDSDTLSALLFIVAGSDAIVDRSGSRLVVARTPWEIGARVVPGQHHALGVELFCRSPAGEEQRFEDVLLIPAVAPWIQLETGAFHPLDAGVGGSVLEELQEADFASISPDDLDRFLSIGLAALERLCPRGVESAEGLIGEIEGVASARLRLEGDPQRLEGALEFRYGDDWMLAPETPEPWTVERDGKVVRYPPAGQALSRAQRELADIGFHRETGRCVLSGPQTLARVLAPREKRFVEFILPKTLQALDLVARPPLLRLEVRPGAAWEGAPGFGLGAARGATGEAGGGAATSGETDGARAATSSGRYGIDWFDVDYRLFDGDRELPIDLAELQRALASDASGVLQLEDGSVLGLDHDAVATLAGLAKPGRVEGGAIRVGLATVAELIDDAPGRETEFDPRLKDLASALRRGEALPQPALRGDFESRLRHYQKDAVRWFGGLARWGVGGILADEMGLGKTVMALAHFFGREDTPADRDAATDGGPVLVVCPTSLIFNWVDECRRFCPGVEVVGLTGLSPVDRAQRIASDDGALLITSYALLRRDREALESREFRAVVLDEGQHIKNATSQTAQAAFALRAREHWILTGTPVENHLGELWSLFHFLLPGFLGTAKEFHERWAEPIRRGDDDARRAIRARVRPFLLRRTKEQVLGELPPRIEQVERVPLGRRQAELYGKYLARARAKLATGDGESARFEVLAALTRLRQVCCDPRLLDDEDARDAESAKFELLMELVEECIEEGHRVLLFSQFTRMLDLIEERLEELGIRRCRLDGSTRDREGQVRLFARDADIPLFLISLKAGGHGLNLTQADTVILYDPWWNPAVEDQAAARAHRMGQTLPVHVHKLVAAGTVEEKILELQAQKRDLAAGVIDGEDGDADALGRLDLAALRGLLGGD